MKLYKYCGRRTAALSILVLTLATSPGSADQVTDAQREHQLGQATESLHATCANCHSCDNPTAQQPCVIPCMRETLREMAQRFDSMHGPSVVILGELENLYLPVPFDHAGHARMAAMTGGCATCHHFTPEGAEHPACKTCHVLDAASGDIRKPGLKGAYHRQCMSCHREWSGETKCGACHLPKTGAGPDARGQTMPTPGDLIGQMHPPIPEPESETYVTEREGYEPTRVLFRHKAHIDVYGLRCAECHREDNCNRCHENGKQHTQHVRTLDEHHQPCFSCHGKAACEDCHYAADASPPPPFNHTSTGWPLKSYHAEKGCRACHASAPFTQRDRQCSSCHKQWTSETFDHHVTDQILDETHAEFDCEMCHAEARFDTQPVCAECHEPEEGIRFPDRKPGPVVEIRP